MTEAATIRVLLVEDNPGDARLVVEALAIEGSPRFDVCGAVRVAEAQTLLRDRSFEVVLLDLALPDSSGMATLEAVRALAGHTPVVVFTGLSDSEAGLDAVRAGAQDYLVKGEFDYRMLSRVVLHALERQRTEEALRESEERLRMKNREVLDFADTVVHDLRKPVTSLTLVLSMMQAGRLGTLNQEGREAVELAAKTIEYMREMLDDLLSCARLEAGATALHFESIRGEDLVRETVDRFRREIEARGISVTEDACGEVWADRKAVAKALLNLVANAVNYTGDKNRPAVAVGCRALGIDEGSLFYVKDNGRGIPAACREEVFGKFIRGTNVADTQGTGLGLAIVKSVVAAHGGKLWLESREGEGTTVSFTIGAAPSGG